MSYATKFCNSNAFADHPPTPTALRNLWTTPYWSSITGGANCARTMSTGLCHDGWFILHAKAKTMIWVSIKEFSTLTATQVSDTPGNAPSSDHVTRTSVMKPHTSMPTAKCPVSKCKDPSTRVSFLTMPSDDKEQIDILKFCKDLEVTLQFKDGIISASDGSPFTYYFDSTSDLKWVVAQQNKQWMKSLWKLPEARKLEVQNFHYFTPNFTVGCAYW